ncbi:dynein axonemal intermediate chain 3-like [Liolophura sinensis]|uniref:dynein axonemal intermediate chain 3-like n=1 Tax=Liolophura sinensis TaxID=3198878 RepID=UPI003158A3FB
MADDKEVTEKEMENAKTEEKDEDTANDGPGTPRSGQKTPTKSVGSPSPSRKSNGSKPVSPTPSSKSGGRASRVSDKSVAKSRQGSSKMKRIEGSSKSRSSGEAETKPDAGTITDYAVFPTAEDGLPEGGVPFFMTSKTQEIVQCRADEDVTADKPFKLVKKQDILDDMMTRAGVSDFTPLKKEINSYPGDEILIGLDADFVFGQNYILILSEETKNVMLTPPVVEGEGSEAAADGDKEVEDDTVYDYVPPEPKEWISQGSEMEIEEEAVQETRRRIQMSIRRVRREFGAPISFSDRNVADAKDGYVECLPFEDKTFDLKRLELDKSIQAIPEFRESTTQTSWKYPRRVNTQYYPREFTEEEKKDLESSEQLQNFIEGVTPRFELALQQNEIVDVFYDDWINLGDGDDTFGSKADNHLKEYQSFTDLQFSKDKTVTHIEWHPVIKGVVAVSVGQRMSFDDKIDHAAKVIMTPSLILIWSFTDPIHPQLLLEAPDDILCFKFSASDSNILAGGCRNGQVVLWDITAHVDRLKQPRGGNRNKRSNVLPGFEDENAFKTPIIRYCAVSGIEHSHKAPITDIIWLPDHFEVNRMGVPAENRQLTSCQLMTCAADYCILFWDTRAPKSSQATEDKGPKNPLGVTQPFKHLDLTWKPMLKVTLHKSEPGGDHSPTKFTIQERQGDRSALSTSEGLERENSNTGSGGGYSYNKPGSAKEKRTLNSVKTHFYVGTEDGELVYVDWMPQKDQDTGKVQTPKPDYYHSLHDGPIISLQRSPFFKDIILCVGGWTFTLWKEGVSSGPILHSAASSVRLSAAQWSPSRPAVFYIARMDGSVDVWDLLDKTHEPSLNQNVSSAAITDIYPFQVSQKQHLLGVGDSSGTLHIMEIPWSLKHPTTNELTGMTNYLEREVKRRAFVVQRWDFREQEKRELEQEQKRKMGIAPQVQLTDEEVEMRLKAEYQQYVEDESNFLRALGLKDDTEELIPESA